MCREYDSGSRRSIDSGKPGCYRPSKREAHMLKGISPLLSPELLKIIAEMGHGDELVIADGNFPSAGMARRLVRADGHAVPALLDAILALFPLDSFVERPAALMSVVPGDQTKPVIWDEFRTIVRRHRAGFQGLRDGGAVRLLRALTGGVCRPGNRGNRPVCQHHPEERCRSPSWMSLLPGFPKPKCIFTWKEPFRHGLFGPWPRPIMSPFPSARSRSCNGCTSSGTSMRSSNCGS